jgi:hypothetical protein
MHVLDAAGEYEQMMEGKLLTIYICNIHVFGNLLLIYIYKLHWKSTGRP